MIVRSPLAVLSQVLSRDIRSLNQRLNIHPVGSKAGQQQQQQQQAAGTPALAAASSSSSNHLGSDAGAISSRAAGDGDGNGDGEAARGRYIVVLDGMDVTYDLEADGTVVLRGVFPLGGGVDGGEELAAAAGAEAEERARRLAGAAV
jgi:hypothetical protein